MSEVCVVVIDAARARFFSLEGHAETGVKGGPDLVELEDLVNPNATLKDSDKYSDSKLFRAPGAGATAAMHGHDDSHARHDAEDERRFARRIADEAVKLADQQKASNLVLAAEGKMLGMLRQAMPQTTKFAVKELHKDLSKLSAHELHEYLAKENIVPPRQSL